MIFVNVQLRYMLALLFFAQGAQAVTVTNVSHSPSYVSSSDSKIQIRYKLSEPAMVTLNIYDDRDILIKSVAHPKTDKKENVMIWDMMDNSGKRVPPEAYHYSLHVRASGKVVVYDTTDITGGKHVALTNLNWDRATKKVSYTINKPARVSLRVGIDNSGPLLASVLNWLPRKSGNHIESWDGFDEHNELDINTMKNTMLHARAYSLSSNTIIIGPEIMAPTFIQNLEWGEKKRNRTVNNNQMFDYMAKTAEDRSDYTVSLGLPDASGAGVHSGVIPVKISLDVKNRIRVLEDRFEPMLFVDGKYVAELETGFFPLTWKLDTTDFINGEHFLTVNLRGYDGQFGVASRKIVIRN